MMVDMVDPTRQTGVVRGYSYRQLFTRPLIGGGSSPRFRPRSSPRWVFRSSRSPGRAPMIPFHPVEGPVRLPREDRRRRSGR
jgi:hypothetical protein